MTEDQYRKGGYAKQGVSGSKFRDITSRVLDVNTGKVYRGESGKRLRDKQLQKQAYHERNRKS